MNNYDENQTALASLAPANRDLKRNGGYPAYSRYPAVETEKNSVREYWRIIRRHKWIILATVVVLVTIVTIGTMLTRPVYRAEAKIEIGKETERVLQGQRILELESANVFNPLFLQTQIDILHSRDLSQRVIQRLNLAENEEFKSKSEQQPDANTRDVLLVNAFQRRYNVAVGRQSRVVTLSFDAYNPKLASEVANTIANDYIAWSMENRLQGVSTAKEFLTKRVEEAELNRRRAETEYQQYLAEHKIISTDERGNITVARTEQLNRQLAEVENERRAAEALYASTQEVPADELPPVLNDPTVQSLTRELNKQKQ